MILSGKLMCKSSLKINNFIFYGIQNGTFNKKRITSTNHPMYKIANELYRISFPFHEQRENLSQKEYNDFLTKTVMKNAYR